MKSHWAKIKYTTVSVDMNQVDDDPDTEKVAVAKSYDRNISHEPSSPKMIEKCTGIVVRGFKVDRNNEEIYTIFINDCGWYLGRNGAKTFPV